MLIFLDDIDLNEALFSFQNWTPSYKYPPTVQRKSGDSDKKNKGFGMLSPKLTLSSSREAAFGLLICQVSTRNDSQWHPMAQIDTIHQHLEKILA